MKNLLTKLGVTAGLAIGSIMQSGCAQLAQNVDDTLAAHGPALVGTAASVYLGNRAQEMALEGNSRGALATQIGAESAGYAVERSLAEAGRSNVGVRIINSSSESAPNRLELEKEAARRSAATLPTSDCTRMYLAADLNKDGIIAGEGKMGELLGEQYGFNQHQTVAAVYANDGNYTRHIRFILNKEGILTLQSQFVSVNPVTQVIWGLFQNGGLQGPGDYELLVIDNEGKALGRKLFSVRNTY